MRALAVILAAAGLAACASPADAPLSSTFGQAVASMDSQIIDPTPAEGLPETSGARAVMGIRKYQEDRVTQPVSTYTERIVSGPEGGSGDEGDSGGGGSDSPK